MARFDAPVRHAWALLRSLGPRRFFIVLICWTLRRYGSAIRPVVHRLARWTGRPVTPREPVLVYQMSKVGSTSLSYSLQLADLKAGLPHAGFFHAHTLTNLDLHERLVRDANGPAHHLALVQHYKHLRAMLDTANGQAWTIISLVRDPVARQMSDFFHHFDRNIPDWRQRERDGSLTPDLVMQRFLEAADPTLHWFEGEILGVLGIDVYATPFPHEKGYAIYSRPPRFSLMVIRLEDMDRVATAAMRDLLGMPDFKLHAFNLGSETGYSNLYQQFKHQPLPAWYLQKMYSGRLAQHFYTPAELEQFTQKWLRSPRQIAATAVV